MRVAALTIIALTISCRDPADLRSSHAASRPGSSSARPKPASSRGGPVAERVVEAVPRVIRDYGATCPVVRLDRERNIYLAARAGPRAELGVAEVPGEDTVVVGRDLDPRAGGAWRRLVTGPEPLAFTLADSSTADGVAVAGVATGGVSLAGVSVGGRRVFAMIADSEGTVLARLALAAHGPPGAQAPIVTDASFGADGSLAFAATASEAVDVAPGRSTASGRTTAFIAIVSRGATRDVHRADSGTSIRSRADVAVLREARHGSTPRLARARDGTLFFAYEDPAGRSFVERLDHDGTTMWRRLLDAAPHARVDAIVTAAEGEGALVAGSGDIASGDPTFRLSRLSAAGAIEWTRSFDGEPQPGALLLRANGDVWLAGWIDSVRSGCANSLPRASNGVATSRPALVVVSADGRTCRSTAIASRASRWSVAASLVEAGGRRVLFSTTYLGELLLLSPPERLNAGSVGSRCAVLDLPADDPFVYVSSFAGDP